MLDQHIQHAKNAIAHGLRALGILIATVLHTNNGAPRYEAVFKAFVILFFISYSAFSLLPGFQNS